MSVALSVVTTGGKVNVGKWAFVAVPFGFTLPWRVAPVIERLSAAVAWTVGLLAGVLAGLDPPPPPQAAMNTTTIRNRKKNPAVRRTCIASSSIFFGLENKVPLTRNPDRFHPWKRNTSFPSAEI